MPYFRKSKLKHCLEFYFTSFIFVCPIVHKLSKRIQLNSNVKVESTGRLSLLGIKFLKKETEKNKIKCGRKWGECYPEGSAVSVRGRHCSRRRRGKDGC